MSTQSLLNLKPDSTGYQILPGLISLVQESGQAESFVATALQLVVEQTATRVKTDQIAVFRGIKGQWREVAAIGSSGAVPEDLLSEVLDRNEPLAAGDWSATPIYANSDHLLVLRATPGFDPADLREVAIAVGAVWEIVQRTGTDRQRVRRLAAMLEMTVAWNQTQETEELLQTMAETSTRLMDAERATIFLQEPGSEMLIGRPALGVEGGELRVPRDSGVVGQVVATGQPNRVDVDIVNEQAQIDRTVDEQLGFQTRSLICVPMFDQQGETIGAFELLNKKHGNFTQSDEDALSELAAHAAVAIENTQYIQQLRTSRKQVADEAADKVQMIGESPLIQDLKQTIERVAETELAVLILGENGTGKEVVAQMVHYLSPRRDHVLVAVNCAAISETLLESELFGHEKGAFTDAHEARPGKFELADGGTLFLDEIGDMSLSGQAKLLRVLEEKVVVRVGGSRTIATDARVIAATNQDLGQLVRERKFREDLFFRLNVVNLTLPPLRERGEDIITLAQHFLVDFCRRARRPVPKLTAAARKRLLAHAWPGNVRELRNMMERLAYLFTEEKVDAGDLAFVMTAGAEDPVVPMDLPLTEATRQFQADYIERHIKRANGNMTEAAERMGLHRSNLYRKMKQLDMDTDT